MHKALSSIRRYGLLSLILMVWGCNLYAQGNILSDTITWPRMNGTVYSLLGEVSKASGILFIYDSALIDNERKVKIAAGKRSVERMINTIVNNEDLHLRILGKHVLITTKPKDDRSHSKPALHDTLAARVMVRGRLTDKQSGEPLSNASIYIPSASLGSVTNVEGSFLLRLPDSLRQDTIQFSHLGYEVCKVEVSQLLNDDYVIELSPMDISLQEVVIRQIESRSLIQRMIESRQRNLFKDAALLTVFYRECVEYKHKFQQLSEAVFEVYKTPFGRDIPDQVRMVKGSKIDNVSLNDSLQVKISAGIESCMILDIAKNLPDFLCVDEEDNPFVYSADGIDYIDGKWANVVNFKQSKNIKSPLYCGKLYFDSNSDALLHAEFELHPKYVAKAANHFITKRAKKYKLIPQSISYTVSYKECEEGYFISYIRGDLRFKVKRNGLFTSSPSLYTWFEMVTCNVDANNAKSFTRAERINTRSVFSELDTVTDEDFWKDYNIIPLERELSLIIQQISLTIEKTETQ